MQRGVWEKGKADYDDDYLRWYNRPVKMVTQAKNCAHCKESFSITKDEQDFYLRINVPAPKRCPQCRFIRRLLERNTRNLYRRKCDFSGEYIISQYHDKSVFPVYHWKNWWSDNWDALKYGRDIDWKRPFFPQFAAFKKITPHFSAFVIGETLENSDYTNCTGYLKNCYLIFEADYNEDCYFCNRIYHSVNLLDCMNCYKCELCYRIIDCQNCYNLKYSTDCESCSDSYFLSNCKSCKNCIGCINLRHKEYCVFNKQYTKEEYSELLKKYDLADREKIKKLANESKTFWDSQPHKNLQQEHNENCVGDYLYNSKNSFYCFDCKDLEDCKYCARVSMTVKNSMDYTGWGDKSELIYDCAAVGNNAYNLKFCTNCTTNNFNLEYCLQCTSCDECFGCVGLQRKKYCILNKQYSKEQYFEAKKRLIALMGQYGEYGEFFPVNISQFAYNETLAMELFPISMKEALKQGFNWHEEDAHTAPATYKSPSRISEVNDITDETLACDKCGKNFKIISQELKFYKNCDIPIPLQCPNCRHFARLSTRNPKKILERTCSKCAQQIKTTYPVNVKSPIYCEQCYSQYI